MKSFKLPKNFLLGTATAALQIEGGDRNNSWFRWAEQGHIQDGSHCITACDHWNRMEEDMALMQALNCRTYRLGLEWSRIEPEAGKFNSAAIAHYRDEISRLLATGIRPLVTLHHFSNPLWLEDRGAWLNPKAGDWFERYVAYTAEQLGDLVSDWITINEPNVYLTFGYIAGIWPPGKQNRMIDYFKGARNMILAHIRAYRTLHAVRERMGRSDTQVGVAYHLRIFEPKRGRWREKRSAALHERLFQEIFIHGMGEGILLPPAGIGAPLGRGRYQDFFGINYYSRDMVSARLNPLTLFGSLSVKEGAAVNDLGWEIYPEGLFRLCKKYYRRYRIPIYITENGTCDARDAFRTRYIYDHLAQVNRAIETGIDIQRYYHWTLMDNFEWAEGLSARFGLIEVDFATQQRTIRSSGQFYGEICKEGGVTDEMLQRYFSG